MPDRRRKLTFVFYLVVVGHQDPSPPGKKERLHRLPALISTNFVGRQEELKSMRQNLTSENSGHPRRSVICGVGGAGKSRLAHAYYAKYASEFSAAFWVSGKDVTSMRNDYVAISRYLKLPEAPPLDATDAEKPQSQIAAVEAVVRWFEGSDGDWLLIIDNLEMEAEDLSDYLPSGEKGHVIITTQNRQAASLGPTIDLGEMSQQDALQLFLSHANLTQPTDQELAICEEIISKLGGLALAVEHAAAFVQLDKMPQRYLQQLEGELGNALERSPNYTNHKLSVMATYKVTFQAIFESHRQAAYLLTFIGALDGESLPERILRAPAAMPMIKGWCVYDSKDWNFLDDYSKALDMLLSYSLVHLKYLEDGSTAITMHALVHKCVQAKRNQESQWIYLYKAAMIILIVTTKEPYHASTFAQVRYLLKTVTERAQQPSTGKVPEDIWLLLGHLVFAHRTSWQAAGNVQELNAYAETIMNALKKSEREQDRLAMVILSTVYAATVAYCNKSQTAEEASLAFLYGEMLPAVSETLRAADKLMAKSSEVITLDFRPTTLDAVYRHTEPPQYVLVLREFMKSVARFYMGRDQPEMGALYYHMSQLPLKSTILSTVRGVFSSLTAILPAFVAGPTAEDELCQLQKKAAYGRAAGEIDSTVELFRFIISKDRTGPEDPVFDVTLCDYIKLLCKLGRREEAAEALDKFKYPSPEQSEADIAMDYKDYYLWIRKAFVMAKDHHDTHPEVERQLQDTYSVTKAVFGTKSLNAMHAAFLLQTFYSQSCCYNHAMVQKYSEDCRQLFAQLYGGKTKLQKSEGLYMAKILLSQGALEEAVFCLALFAELAEGELGPGDPIAVTARRLTEVAKREREEELEEVRSGKVSLRWGCCSFTRDISRL